MYGYIYKTTNLLNEKIYVGQHKSKDGEFDLNYYGSGKLILDAIDKYGKENFTCELIEWCDSENELNEKEIFWIKEFKSTTKNNNYNISDGGYVPRLTGEANGNFGKHRPHTEEEKKHHSEILKGHKPTFKGPHKEDARLKISKATSEHNKTRDYSKVSKHNVGSKMMTNGEEQHWVYKDDIQNMLDKGWYFGSCKPRKPRKPRNISQQN